jgi:hypothetical protein
MKKNNKYAIIYYTQTLLWHKSWYKLIQLRWQRDNVVRFLHLFKFGLVVFYRICFWKASGSRETPARSFLCCKKLWLLPRRGRVVCELCMIVWCVAMHHLGCEASSLFVSKLPQHDTSQPTPSSSPNHHTSSCSAQTLRRVSSLKEALRNCSIWNLFLEGERQS